MTLLCRRRLLYRVPEAYALTRRLQNLLPVSSSQFVSGTFTDSHHTHGVVAKDVVKVHNVERYCYGVHCFTQFLCHCEVETLVVDGRQCVALHRRLPLERCLLFMCNDDLDIWIYDEIIWWTKTSSLQQFFLYRHKQTGITVLLDEIFLTKVSLHLSPIHHFSTFLS